jgi:uncharacterized protein (DUF1501 family)
VIFADCYTKTEISLTMATMSSSGVLEQKLAKVLDMRTNTPAMLESLQSISSLIVDASDNKATNARETPCNTTGDFRRCLREDLEMQVCEGSIIWLG